jgi:DNA-binding NtrC family response regulator
MHRAVLLSGGPEIEISDIRLPDGSALGTTSALNPHVATAGQAILAAQTVQSAPANLVGRTIEAVEQEMILDTLKHCYGNRTHAAQILGISIRTLRNKLKLYLDAGIDVPAPGANEPRFVYG